MAHPILKITNNKTDYYIVWDTYHDLPESIPMDLATFIVFLYENRYSFSAFIVSWKNLQENNVSLEATLLDNFLKESELDFLQAQAEDNYVNYKELINRELSTQIKVKLDALSLRYYSTILNSSKQALELLLEELHDEFYLFINEILIYNISLLPLHLYCNINLTYDKLYTQIDSIKLDDFLGFLYSNHLNNIDAQRAADWFCKLLFKKNFLWHEIPYFLRKKVIITNNSLVINNLGNSGFIRKIDDINVTELDLTAQNLLSYFNHLINEQYPFANEIKTHFQDIGLIGDNSNFIKLDKLINSLNANLIDSQFLPPKLFNFSDKDGGLLLPSIYTDYYEDNGLIKFYKYNVQLIDVYSNYGDLIFTNLEDITFIERDNQLLAIFEEEGHARHKKIIVEHGSPIQIQSLAPFNYFE